MHPTLAQQQEEQSVSAEKPVCTSRQAHTAQGSSSPAQLRPLEHIVTDAAPLMPCPVPSSEHTSASSSALPEITSYADPEDLDEEVIAEEENKKKMMHMKQETETQLQLQTQVQARAHPPIPTPTPTRVQTDRSSAGSSNSTTRDATAARIHPTNNSLSLTRSQSYPYAGVIKSQMEAGPLSANPSLVTSLRRQNPLSYHGPSLAIVTSDACQVSMSASLSPLSAEPATPLSLPSGSRKNTLTDKLSTYFFGKKWEREPQHLPFRRSQSLLMGLESYNPPAMLEEAREEEPMRHLDHVASSTSVSPLGRSKPDAKQSVIEEFREREHDFGNNLKLLQSFIMNVEIAERDKKILLAGLQDLILLSDKLSQGLAACLANDEPTNSNVGTLFLTSASHIVQSHGRRVIVWARVHGHVATFFLF